MKCQFTMKTRAYLMVSLSTCLFKFAIAQNDVVSFKEALRPDQHQTMIPPMLRSSELEYYFPGDTALIFPGTDLIGSFTIVNHNTDTLKLSLKGESPLKYLKLHWDANKRTSINIHYKGQSGETLNTGELPSWAMKNMLAPSETLRVDILIPWIEISKLKNVHKIYWSLNNSKSISSNNRVAIFNYESEPYILNIKSLASKSDSLQDLRVCRQIGRNRLSGD